MPIHDEMTIKTVWDSLVARGDDPQANAIGKRFTDAVAAVLTVAKQREVILNRYLGDEYDWVLRRIEGLEPEDAARIINDRVKFRVADGKRSPGDLCAIRDAIARVGELDWLLGEALQRLSVAFEEAVSFLCSESRR